MTTPGGQLRAPESARALEIRWERRSRITKDERVVTGVSVAGDDQPGAAVEFTQPMLVLIADELSMDSAMDRLEANTLGDEKVALGSKAFRCIRMAPEDAEREPLLEGHGEAVPRMVVFNPADAEAKVYVLEKTKQLGAKSVYRAMTRTAKAFYDTKLDTIVRKNLKILASIDKLSPEEYKLKAKRDDLDEDEDTKADRLDKQLEKIATEKQELLDEAAELWDTLLASVQAEEGAESEA